MQKLDLLLVVIALSEHRPTPLIKERFPQALAVEMEATAIAQTCHQFKQPFIITRAISDLANGNADITFEQFIEQAALSSSKTVERLIKQI